MQPVSHLLEALSIAIGGSIGAVSRFYLSLMVQTYVRTDFPYGILVVNSLGCFLMGLLAAWLSGRSSLDALLRAGLLVGLLGGFTTFSSFSLDNIKLFQQGSYLAASANILLSVGVGMLLTGVGWWLGKVILSR